MNEKYNPTLINAMRQKGVAMQREHPAKPFEIGRHLSLTVLEHHRFFTL